MGEYWQDLMPTPEELLASAVHYLIQGDQKDEALSLLFCDAQFIIDDVSYVENGNTISKAIYTVYLTGPRMAFEAMNRTEEHYDEGSDIVYSDQPIMRAVKRAFEAVSPPRTVCKDVVPRVQLVEIQPDWRNELKEIAHGRQVHNQGVEIPGREISLWNNMRFRSMSEVQIAKALDARKALFLPNCLARLNNGESRLTKEADFLVCYRGKWGILEVDGPYHPRAADDHERDRLFQQHGIKVTQRFSAESCYQDAPGIVQKFLTLLEQNG